MKKYLAVRPWAGGEETTIRQDVEYIGGRGIVALTKRQLAKILIAGGYHGERGAYQVRDAWRGSAWVDAVLDVDSWLLEWDAQACEI